MRISEAKTTIITRFSATTASAGECHRPWRLVLRVTSLELIDKELTEHGRMMIDHFGLLAPFYDRFIEPPDPARLQELLRLPTAGALLDVGGGTGRVSQALESLVDTLVVSDESVPMLRQAQEKALCCPAAGQAEWLPFATASFERVLVVDALHHFADQQRAIAEMVRVLRPGGRLVVEEPDLNRLPVKLVAIGEKMALMRSRFFYPHEIGRMVAACGLQPIIEGDGRFAAWIVADKVPGEFGISVR